MIASFHPGAKLFRAKFALPVNSDAAWSGGGLATHVLRQRHAEVCRVDLRVAYGPRSDVIRPRHGSGSAVPRVLPANGTRGPLVWTDRARAPLVKYREKLGALVPRCGDAARPVVFHAAPGFRRLPLHLPHLPRWVSLCRPQKALGTPPGRISHLKRLKGATVGHHPQYYPSHVTELYHETKQRMSLCITRANRRQQARGRPRTVKRDSPSCRHDR